MLDRSVSPQFKSLDDKYEVIKPQTSYLKNNIPVHVLRSGIQPIIRIEFILKAGYWQEPQNGLAYFTTKMLGLGSSNLSAHEIEDKIAFYGAFMELGAGPDKTNLTFYLLSKHLKNLLPIISEIILSPSFPEEELNRLKIITNQNLKINLNKTSYVASYKFKELLFGADHPYGRALTEEAIDKIDIDSIKNFYSEYFSSKNCDIIISGNGTEDFVEIFNNSDLGKTSWGKASVTTQSTKTKISTNQFEIVKKENSVQSSIRVGLPLFTIKHPDYFKTYVLIEILGGYFGSRLMKNIREDKGYTYGIHSNFVTQWNEGYLVIGTDVKKEFTSNTLKEIYKEMTILKTELIGEEELNAVKNYLIGSFINSLTTPFSLADKFKTVYFNSLDYSFYDNYLSTIKNITPEEILATANKYFNLDAMLEVVVGDKVENVVA